MQGKDSKYELVQEFLAFLGTSRSRNRYEVKCDYLTILCVYEMTSEILSMIWLLKSCPRIHATVPTFSALTSQGHSVLFRTNLDAECLHQPYASQLNCLLTLNFAFCLKY